MLVVRVLLFVILLSDMKMMSNLHLKKLRKNFNSLMWSGKDDIFRWINERSFSLIFGLLCHLHHSNHNLPDFQMEQEGQLLV